MKRALLIPLLFLPFCATKPAQPPAADPLATLVRQLEDAVRAKPHESGAELYTLAAIFDQSKQTGEAVKRLEQLDTIGWTHGVDPTDFPNSREDAAYQNVAARLDAKEPKIVRSTQAYVLTQRDLIPEGIAHDPVTDRLFVSSIYLRKVISIDRDGTVRDFVAEGQDEMFSSLGMKVDAQRRRLWVISGAAPMMKGFTKEHTGLGTVHVYDLDSGKLLKRFEVGAADSRAMVNDLALTADGTAYITDTNRHLIWRATIDSELLEVWTEGLLYPNGIAVSPDQRYLYVADFRGLNRFDLADKSRQMLHPPTRGETLAGIDGLWLHGEDLIAIQNAVGRPRVLRIALDANRSNVERVDVLESGNPLFITPTTGVVVGDDYYFMANPQLRAFDKDGKILPWEQLRDVVILKLGLKR